MQRHRCTALMLILLIGHAALTLHVATHVQAELNNCELCTGHANPAHAIAPPAVELPLPAASARIDTGYTAPFFTTVRPFAYRPRAPPKLG